MAGGGLNQAAGDAAALYRMAGNVGCLISDRVILLTPGAEFVSGCAHVAGPGRF